MHRRVLVGQILLLLTIAQSIHAEEYSFTAIGDLPGSSFHSAADGISGDGSTVVGSGRSTSGWEAFRWTFGSGMTGLGDLAGGSFSSGATAASYDGSVIVGGSSTAVAHQAFRWTEAGGMVSLGNGPTGNQSTTAWGVSGDGSVVVGNGEAPEFIDDIYPWSWTPGGGMNDFTGAIFGSAVGVSGDGSVVTGWADTFSPVGSWPYRSEPSGAGFDILRDSADQPFAESGLPAAVSADGRFIVGTEVDGINGYIHMLGEDPVDLGHLPNHPNGTNPTDVSGDGSFVVGSTLGIAALSVRAFIWDESNGIRDLQAILESQGIDLTGWELLRATGVSDDGRVIIGTGLNPNGDTEGWVVVRSEPVPQAVPALGSFGLSILVGSLVVALVFFDRKAPGVSRTAFSVEPP